MPIILLTEAFPAPSSESLVEAQGGKRCLSAVPYPFVVLIRRNPPLTNTAIFIALCTDRAKGL
jgi:hypothetical protein